MADPITQPNSTDVSAVTPFYLDKAVWVAVLSPLFLWLNQKFGLTMDAGQLAALALPIVAYILGHKWKSGVISVAQVNAQAAAVAPAAQLNK